MLQSRNALYALLRCLAEARQVNFASFRPHIALISPGEFTKYERDMRWMHSSLAGWMLLFCSAAGHILFNVNRGRRLPGTN
jgi:hypothetical protein